MSDSTQLWYRLGYALETARRGSLALRPPSERKPAARSKNDPTREREPEAGEGGPLDLVLAAGSGTVLARLLAAWPGRGRPSISRLARGAAAGAGAALLRQAVSPLLRGSAESPAWDEHLPERLLAGGARGLVYAGVLEPRLPGIPVLSGAVYGTAEYALSPWGGLRGLLGRHAPYRRLSVLAGVLDEAEPGEDSLADHLAFGLALALLYGSDGDRIGIEDDEE